MRLVGGPLLPCVRPSLPCVCPGMLLHRTVLPPSPPAIVVPLHNEPRPLCPCPFPSHCIPVDIGACAFLASHDPTNTPRSSVRPPSRLTAPYLYHRLHHARLACVAPLHNEPRTTFCLAFCFLPSLLPLQDLHPGLCSYSQLPAPGLRLIARGVEVVTAYKMWLRWFLAGRGKLDGGLNRGDGAVGGGGAVRGVEWA
jgi:hypothetical protein